MRHIENTTFISITRKEKRFLYKLATNIFQQIYEAYKIEDYEARYKFIKEIENLNSSLYDFIENKKHNAILNNIVSVSIKDEEEKGNKFIKKIKVMVVSNQIRAGENVDVIDIFVFRGIDESWGLVNIEEYKHN